MFFLQRKQCWLEWLGLF